MPSSSSYVNMEISSTGIAAGIKFVEFIWCRIDDSYDGDNDDDNNNKNDSDYDVIVIMIISLSSTIVQTGR